MNTNKVLCTFILVVFSLFKVEAQQSYKTLIFEGNKAYKNKKYDLAATKFSEAIKLKESGFEAHYNLGNALYKAKRYEEAKAEYQKAEKLAKNTNDRAAANYNLGNTLMESKQPEKAAEFYKKALKNDPYNESIRKNYEIAKLKEKEKQQDKNNPRQDQNGNGGQDKDQSQNQDKGDQKKEQGNGSQQKSQQGEGDGDRDKKHKNVPDGLEKAVLDQTSDKERNTARRILNRTTYSVPASKEKDW